MSGIVSIGRYQVRDEIGQGGMATVYRATDPDTGVDLAIKLMAGHLAQDVRFRKRFQREADVLSRLRHAGIVGIISFGEHDSRPYLVMPFIGGGTLSDRLERGPLSPGQIAAILPPLADALDYAHVRGIVHRDIKPSNILFDAAGRPYLTDFGIVKVLGEASTTVTRTGTWLGTPDYMSPEQVNGVEALDGRSDVYSLGIVLFEMLTGRLPFENTNPIAIAVKHLNEPPPRLRDVAPGLAAGWQPILDRALAKSPEDRYPSASALAADVIGLAREIPSPPPAQRTKPRPTPRSTPQSTAGRAPVLPLALAALAVVVLGGGLLWSLRPDSPATPRPTAAVAAATPNAPAVTDSLSPARPTSTVAPAATTPPAEGTIVAVVADAVAETPPGLPRFRLTEPTGLRAGPGTLFANLAALSPGEVVEILARDEVWAWYNVRLDDGRTGWALRQAGELADSVALSSIEIAATIPAPPFSVTPTVAPPTATLRPAATLPPTQIVVPATVVVPPTAAPPQPPEESPTDPPPPIIDPTAPPLEPTAAIPPTPAIPPTAAVP